jgi:hypothetical protein
MSASISIERLIQTIQRLPSDSPVNDPQKWYKTQKEHWLGWLSEYYSPGAYCRQTAKVRNAKFAYNHVVEPKMLIWIIEAAGVDPIAVNGTKRAALEASTMQQKSAAIRRTVSWETLAHTLWGGQVKR